LKSGSRVATQKLVVIREVLRELRIDRFVDHDQRVTIRSARKSRTASARRTTPLMMSVYGG
jgi:hypothetical protein